MTQPTDTLDVAIVGGGISGLYSGWRLLTGRTKDGHTRPQFACNFRAAWEPIFLAVDRHRPRRDQALSPRRTCGFAVTGSASQSLLPAAGHCPAR